SCCVFLLTAPCTRLSCTLSLHDALPIYFQAEFLTGWRLTATYQIRHLAPNGMGHRIGFADMFKSIWELNGDTCTIGGMIPRKTIDRKSTRLNSSHVKISYAVFCLKKKTV